ncbi:MAG: YggS family pyridoxal phosphate-dependent enzyme [Elusimicrobiales bacterium]
MTDAALRARISAKLDLVFGRVAAACARAGRSPGEVEVMAVTKYASPLQIGALVEDGRVSVLGESRVQQAEEKWRSPELEAARPRVKLHFIGHLQSNKAGRAAMFFDAVDSIDGMAAASALGRKAEEAGRTVFALIQVKLTGRETQSGVVLEEASRLAGEASAVKGLRVRGYMAIAPQVADPQELRPYFRRLKGLFDADFPQPPSGERNYLSLGMSGDFEVAVEEGSNLPRVGSAIFE